MNIGTLVGGIIEIMILVGVGLSFLFLFFKPKSKQGEILKNMPIIGTLFKYKYSFLIASALCLLTALLNLLNLLGKP